MRRLLDACLTCAAGLLLIARGASATVGSGVILDPDGFIVTNAHVVAGAVRLQVVLSPSTADDAPARC